MYVSLFFSLKRFFKAAGSEWRSSKYLHAIRSLQAQQHQIQSCISNLLETNGRLLRIGGAMQSDYNIPIEVRTLGDLTNVTQLPDVQIDIESDTASDLLHSIECNNDSDVDVRELSETRLLKQRTEQWFEFRKKFSVTGSTIVRALGLKTLKEKRQQMRIFLGVEEPEPFPPDVQAKLDDGTKHEPDAVATLAIYVLPHFFPDLSFLEEGSRIISHEGKPLILVSPDGSLCDNASAVLFRELLQTSGTLVIPESVIACEIKCRYPNDYCTPVHYKIPWYYAPQLLAEMVSMQVEQLLFISYSMQSTVVHHVDFDPRLWSVLMMEVVNVYGNSELTLPTTHSPERKAILSHIND